MSMNPNNPFDDHQNDQGYAQSPTAKKGGKGCLLGCGIVGLLSVLVCCGGGALMTQFGLGVLASEYEQQLAGNPVIEEHIGEIESLDVSWTATFREAQKAEEQGEESPFAFEIKGSKGSGTLLVRQDRAGDGTEIGSATLVMPDGSRHAVTIDRDEFEDLENLKLEDLDLDIEFDHGSVMELDEQPAASDDPTNESAAP